MVVCAKLELETWVKYLGCRYGVGKVWGNMNLGDRKHDVYNQEREGVWVVSYEELGSQLQILRNLKK